MEDKKKNYPSKLSLILRIVVSVYLWYLVWGLRGAPAGHEGIEKVLYILAMVIFAAAGLILGGLALRAYVRGEYKVPGDDDDSEDAEE